MPAVVGEVEVSTRRLRGDQADRAAANLTGGRRDFTWIRELNGTPNGDAPVDIHTSCTCTAEVEIPPLRPTILHRKTASGDGGRNQQSARRV